MTALVPKSSMTLVVALLVSCGTTHKYDAPGHARIEFRFAEDAPGEDTTPARPRGSDTDVHLHSEVLFSNRDIAAVEEQRDATGRPTIVIEFTDEAAERLKEVTGENKGKKLAIIVDGEVLQAPTIQGKIAGGNARITGDFTDEDVQAYVRALQGLKGDSE